MSLHSPAKNTLAFQFKAGLASCLIFEMFQYDVAEITHQLETVVSRTPEFFKGAVVVIDISLLHEHAVVDFNLLINLFKNYAIHVIGIKGGKSEQQKAANVAGLPLINLSKTIARESILSKKNTTKLITHPIRSGMQIYAKGADLIVTGQISPGAELLADGNIYIYGCLRGRVLAGVNGDQTARIFCQTLDAELVSVAGIYITNEALSALSLASQQIIQIYIDKDKLQIEPWN